MLATYPNLGKSGNVVLTLMSKYLRRELSFYVYNWYTSPALFSYLHRNKTNASCTVKVMRNGMPNLNRKLLWSQPEHQCNTMFAIKYPNKHDVRMSTPIHTNEMVSTDKKDRTTGEAIIEPKCIVDYHQNMGAVDKTDLTLSSIETVWKTVKWYKMVCVIYKLSEQTYQWLNFN